MEVDEAMKKLGFYGKWQISVYILVGLTTRAVGTWHLFSIVWIGYKPPHHCKVPANSSVEEWIPLDASEKLSSCLIFVNSSNHTTACANGWTYDDDDSGPTIVTKWNLVCDRAYLSDLSQMAFVIGYAIGGFTKPADVFGRKWIIIIDAFLMAFFSILTTTVDKLEIFIFLTLICGVFTGGANVCSNVFIMENFSSDNRMFFMLLKDSLYGVAISLLILIAYFLKSWIYLLYCVNIYTFAFIPILIFCLHETVPWLHANNRMKEAEEVLLFAAKLNNVTFERPIFIPLQENNIELKGIDENNENEEKEVLMPDKTLREKMVCPSFVNKIKNIFVIRNKSETALKTQYSLMVLVKNRYLRRHMIVSVATLCVNAVFFGTFNISGSLSTNRFLDSFLQTVMDFPACIFIYQLSLKFGKRKPTVYSCLVGAICMFACSLFVSLEEKNSRYSYATLTFTLIFKLLLSGAYVSVHLYASELFPTNIRAQSLGICLLIARIGAVLASYTPLLLSMYPRGLYIGLGVLSAVGGFLTLLLPDTENKALPESIEEIEEWYQKRNGSYKDLDKD